MFLKMSLVAIALALTVAPAYGMDCTFGTSDNSFEKIVKSCPFPLGLGNSDKEYCCFDNNGGTYCCNVSEFITTSISHFLIIIVPVLIIVILIICCLCCFCCPFCSCFKR